MPAAVEADEFDQAMARVAEHGLEARITPDPARRTTEVRVLALHEPNGKVAQIAQVVSDETALGPRRAVAWAVMMGVLGLLEWRDTGALDAGGFWQGRMNRLSGRNGRGSV